MKIDMNERGTLRLLFNTKLLKSDEYLSRDNGPLYYYSPLIHAKRSVMCACSCVVKHFGS